MCAIQVYMLKSRLITHGVPKLIHKLFNRLRSCSGFACFSVSTKELSPARRGWRK
jgi:hypothetical protein